MTSDKMTYIMMMTLLSALLCCWRSSGEGAMTSDVFLSTAEVSSLLESEESLLTFVSDYLTRTAASTGSSKFTRLSRDLQAELDTLPRSQDAKHPVDAYVGLRRFTEYWDKYIAKLNPVVARSVEKSLANNRVVYPDQNALHQARLAIVRMQAIYHLNASLLLDSAHVSLSAEDAALMAVEAQLSGFPVLAEDWKRLAASLFPSESGFSLDGLLAHRRSQKTEDEAERTRFMLRKHARFFSLCQRFQDINDVTLLRSERCEYLVGNTAPLYRWKSEVLSSDPYVVLVYDVVTDLEADVIVNSALHRLVQALTGPSPRRTNLLRVHCRLGKIAWLRDTGSAVLSSVTRRIQEITGLHTAFRPYLSFGEHFQVVNYGVGGHYVPHYDYFKQENAFSVAEEYLKDSGDRAATFMIYLGNVSRGGATVFPELGIGVPPVKNAAIFWNNFTPDGLPDPRSLHGGCPVIIGEKWVVNKWIHEISTAMTRTCKTTPWKADT